MKTSDDVDYNFIYDTTAGIPAVLMEREGTETPKLYIRTPDGRLIARVTATTTPSLDFYYHFDGLGSTLALTDEDGDATDTYTYDAWGNVTHTYGSTDQPYQFVGQLGYYTHYQEPEFSEQPMLQLGVRYYVPQIGRFTQRDELRQGLGHYCYVGDRPTAGIDPSGLVWSIGDWFHHYFYGNGTPVSLDQAGISGLFWGSSPVRDKVRAFERYLALSVKGTVRSQAKTACGNGRKHAILGFSESDLFRPNLTLVPGLFVIGHTTVSQTGNCVISLNCCKRTYRYYCWRNSTMTDSFSDPWDAFNLFPNPVETGTPYDITGSNTGELIGQGTF